VQFAVACRISLYLLDCLGLGCLWEIFGEYEFHIIRHDEHLQFWLAETNCDWLSKIHFSSFALLVL